MKLIKASIKSVALGVALSLVSVAASAGVEEQIKNKIVKFIGEKQNVNFFNSVSGMIGVGLTTKTGKKRVFYATPDGEYLIAGALVETSTGKNISMDEIAKHAPKADFGDLVDTIKESKYLITGNPQSEDEIYVFIDPNCGYCHKAYAMIEKDPKVTKNHKIHWIPVGVLGPSSTNKAQALLGTPAEEQYRSMDAMMTKMPYQAQMEEMENGASALKGNMQIFSGNGFNGVPVVIKKQGDDIDIVEGLPKKDWFDRNG